MRRGMPIETFQDLIVWQKAHVLTISVYKLTATFPQDERFGLISQMRRAAVSVPANIAEGFKKRGKADKANFYNISQGSLAELQYYFILSKDLGYLADNLGVIAATDEIGKMLNSLISTIKASLQ
ncbi:MAG: four helix bundle protein [Elusimicrobia bacterium GWC2_51_8]|nr:MAG: four helix bundle protein [Elusimicrobia bacterium GWA2_51_34]OGR58939.1 MAG: four helix bundle protein [Elusimicrobia bacterium GWC2_51_8]OGR85249.1 MAG: four helix bundle protein [Elusimicrobia bacterium GWF2_52_66]HAF95253.1 four helix bundle protein [Elusimicrobiota bacterium]HCE97331.1 four helix bundle protein [Elusimicrobiota bacterium]